MKPIVLTVIAVWTALNTVAAGVPCKLVEAWATEPVLDIPECALFNPADKLLYVSNISGSPFEKNSKGFIAKVDLSGQIVEMKWSAGLNAPKGMAIHENHLYVTDIDELVKIDLKSGKIVQRYPAQGAVSLNDLAAGADGTIYVSDSRSGQYALHRLMNGKLEPWVETSQSGNLNGLYMQGNKLLAGQAKDGTLFAVDLKTGQMTSISQIDTGIDGLKPAGNGRYFTSNWKGRITLVSETGEGLILQDTTDRKINAADFEYLPEKNLLILPTFNDNRLVAYNVVQPERSVGDPAPLFKAVDQDGKEWVLEDQLGKKPIVVYFYPAAMTGGCTKQACSYRDYVEQNDEPAFDVVGISGDTPENLKHFQQAEGLNFTLLSDPGGRIAKTFGVAVKDGEKSITRTIDGKEVELTRSATTMRWTFIIDPSGKIIYRDNKVNAVQDLQKVKSFLSETK
ncbi:redoxin domain-containing protein [Pontiellaceae bacterium B12227]|nr:redoxin domain-containing protein [Pontiellaceae bacterium B12227]